MLHLVEQLNNAKFDTLYRLEIAGQHVGYVRPQLAELLAAHAPHFLGVTGPQTLSVISADLSPDAVSARFKALHSELADQGLLPKPANEFTDVRPSMTAAPVCQINRNLIFPLGIVSRGVHVILRHENGDFVVAQRSEKVFTFKGAYDVPVGGLLPAGKDPWDHVKREAAEEAGLAENELHPDGSAVVLAYARNVKGVQDGPAYKPAFPFETDGGTNWDEVFYWTATIPDHVVPKPHDDEVKKFMRMSADDLVRSLRDEPYNWKTNSAVMILQALANDPAHTHRFTAKEHAELKALIIPDPRPLDERTECLQQTIKAKVQKGPHPKI